MLRAFAGMVMYRISKNNRPRIVVIQSDGPKDFPADSPHAIKVRHERIVGIYDETCTIEYILEDLKVMMK